TNIIQNTQLLSNLTKKYICFARDRSFAKRNA
ncbi:MAG: hypothetical protein ACI8RD_004474, partial [Bacillariaceae sp.]